MERKTNNDSYNNNTDLINETAQAAVEFISRSKDIANSVLEARKLSSELKRQKQEQKELAPMANRAPGGFTGTVLLLFGLIILALSLGYLMVNYFIYRNTFILLYLFFLVPIIFSIYLIIVGYRLKKRANTYLDFREILQRNPYISVQDLSYKVQMSPSKTLKYINTFLGEHLFPKGELVKNDQFLVLSPRALKLLNENLDEVKRQKQQKEKYEAIRDNYPKLYAVVEEINDTLSFINNISAQNKGIKSNSLKSQLETMNYLLLKIRNYIISHPEEIPDVRSYLNYFLPTVKKLLKTYSDLEKETLVTKNIVESKQEIESVIDSINEAFENMYNDFYTGTALDVYSDVSVLKTVIHQEGLVDSEFTQE